MVEYIEQPPKSFSILRSIASSITMLCLSQGTQRFCVTARKQNTESTIIRYFRPIKNVAILVNFRLFGKLDLLWYLPVNNNFANEITKFYDSEVS